MCILFCRKMLFYRKKIWVTYDVLYLEKQYHDFPASVCYFKSFEVQQPRRWFFNSDKLKRNKLVYDSTCCVGTVLIIILFGSFAIFQTPYQIQAMAKSHEIFSIFCAFVVTVLLLCLLSSAVEIMKMASLLFSGDRIMNSFCKRWRLVLLPFLTALL